MFCNILYCDLFVVFYSVLYRVIHLSLHYTLLYCTVLSFTLHTFFRIDIVYSVVYISISMIFTVVRHRGSSPTQRFCET